jgi:WD40 repeat protein
VAWENRFVSWSFRHPSGYHAPPQLSRPRHVLELSHLGSEAGGLIREAEQAIDNQRYTAAHRALTRARAVPGHERDPEVLRVWRELGRYLPRVGLRATWTTSLFKAKQSNNSMRTASIAADGSVAVTGHDTSTYLWDIKSGDLLGTFTAMFTDAVGVSADGQQVAVACSFSSDTAQVDVWSARTETHLFARGLAKGDRGPRVALMTPDGKRLLWSNGNEIQVLEVDTGRRLRSLPEHPPRGTKAWISADGRIAVSATEDSIRLWNLDNGECLLKIPAPADPFSKVSAVCASLDGKRVVAAGFSSVNLDLQMRMWNLAGETVQDFKCRPSTVDAIQFSPDGRFIFVGAGGTVTVHDAETGALVHTFSGNQGHAENIQVTPDGRYALVWEHILAGQLAQVWELDWELAPTPNHG